MRVERGHGSGCRVPWAGIGQGGRVGRGWPVHLFVFSSIIALSFATNIEHDQIFHRCRKYLGRTFLQYETRTSRAAELKILSFYAFLGPLHIFALLSCRNKDN